MRVEALARRFNAFVKLIYPHCSRDRLQPRRNLNVKQVIIGLAFLTSALFAQADSKTLFSDDGQAVEIMIDFKIEDLRIDAKGTVSLIAKAVENGEAIGFSVVLSSPRKEPMPQMGKDETIPVAAADLTIKSIGAPTAALQASLNRRLRRRPPDVGRRQLVGFYAATSYAGISVAHRTVIQADDPGITADETDASKSAECFFLNLVIDGPMERVTVYFSLPAGYGASPPEFGARQRWYQSKQKAGEGSVPAKP